MPKKIKKFEEVTLNSLAAMIGGLDTKVDGLESKIGSLDAKVDSLDAKVDSLESKIDNGLSSLDAKIDEGLNDLAIMVNAGFGRMENDISGLKKDVLVLNKAVFEQGCDIKDLKTGQAKQGKQIEALSDVVMGAHQTGLYDLKKRVTALEEKVGVVS